MTSSDAGGSPLERFGPAGALLERTAASGRLAPAYLFDAPDPVAPRAAARAFAAALLCTGSPRPCGSCGACARVASGNHPDLHFQGRDKATVISVDALAALLERAHASPRAGARQVFVIEPADAMAPEAVARYLKTLEEPPSTTTFVLVTARPDRLPDTVRSRCQRVTFPAPSEAEVAARLEKEGLEAPRAARLARWGGGSAARARRLAALDADLAVDALGASALGRGPTAASTVESVLAALRARAGQAAGPGEGEAGADPTREVAPGEDLRRALEDLFHALQTAARDRTAGLPAPPFDALEGEAAAAALERLGRLAGLVRRNVNPYALLMEAVAALRRPLGRPPLP